MNLREYAAKQKKPPEGKIEAITGIAEHNKPAADKQPQLPEKYRRIYRAVFDFHARHSPAPHTMEEWQQAAQDVVQTACGFNDEPFIIDLLTAVYNELDRQQKLRRSAPADITETPK